jgi:hypothetical protein
MNCEEISLELVALLYGELDQAAEDQVRVHLTGCGHCQEEWQQLQESRELLTALETDDLPHQRVDLREILPQTTTGVRNRWWRPAAAAALACSAMLVLAAAMGLRITIEQNSITVGWGAAATHSSETADATQQFSDCVERLRELESRLGAAVNHVELNQVRQGAVLASLENELGEVRRRGDVRWRTTNLVRRENQAQINEMRSAVDSVFANLNHQSTLRSKSRLQSGG